MNICNIVPSFIQMLIVNYIIFPLSSLHSNYTCNMSLKDTGKVTTMSVPVSFQSLSVSLCVCLCVSLSLSLFIYFTFI